MKNVRELSLGDKCTMAWEMAYDLLYKENGEIKDLGEDYCNEACIVIDFLPGFIDRWLKGRMSLSDIITWTPEKVEAWVDSLIQSMEDYNNNKEEDINGVKKQYKEI